VSDTKELVLGVSVGAAVIIIAFFSLRADGMAVSSISTPTEEVRQNNNATAPLPLKIDMPTDTMVQLTNQTQQIVNTRHYDYEQKTEPLLEDQIFLIEGGSRLFAINIPDENVTTLSGEITAEGKGFVLASIEDQSGKLYCDGCSVKVFGAQSNASSWNMKGIVNIGVNGRDSMNLKISNPRESELVTVHIKLTITYEKAVLSRYENK